MYRIDKVMDHWTSTKVVTLSRDTARTEYPDFFYNREENKIQNKIGKI